MQIGNGHAANHVLSTGCLDRFILRDMPTGSCYCGLVTVKWDGEPARTALCHCNNCRHSTGSNYSNNILVPADAFKIISGFPKEITAMALSGKQIINCFCRDCGTTMWRYGDTFGGKLGMLVVQAGIYDDKNLVDGYIPKEELFVSNRMSWQCRLEGAAQEMGMPSG